MKETILSYLILKISFWRKSRQKGLWDSKGKISTWRQLWKQFVELQSKPTWHSIQDSTTWGGKNMCLVLTHFGENWAKLSLSTGFNITLWKLWQALTFATWPSFSSKANSSCVFPSVGNCFWSRRYHLDININHALRFVLLSLNKQIQVCLLSGRHRCRNKIFTHLTRPFSITITITITHITHLT